MSNFYWFYIDIKKLSTDLALRRGESAALGRRMPWATRLFFKVWEEKSWIFYMKYIEKVISAISIQVVRISKCPWKFHFSIDKNYST